MSLSEKGLHLAFLWWCFEMEQAASYDRMASNRNLYASARSDARACAIQRRSNANRWKARAQIMAGQRMGMDYDGYMLASYR